MATFCCTVFSSTMLWSVGMAEGDPIGGYNPLNNSTASQEQVYILVTKVTAARNGVALSYSSVRGLYFLAVVFATVVIIITTARRYILGFYELMSS